MADLILIPVVALLFIGAKKSENGFNTEYLKKNNTVALKGICALSIVLLHVGSVTQSKFLPEITAFAVSVFFFLSGYGLMMSLKKTRSYLDGFVYKHTVKIWVPYATAAVCYVLYFLYAQKNLGFKYYDSYDVSVKGIFSAFIEHGYTVVINSWFVVVLFVFYLFFKFSFRKNRTLNEGVETFCILVIVFTVLMFCLAQFKGWYTAWYMQNLSVIIGVLYAVGKNKIDGILKKYTGGGHLCTRCGFVFGFWHFRSIKVFDRYWRRV